MIHCAKDQGHGIVDSARARFWGLTPGVRDTVRRVGSMEHLSIVGPTERLSYRASQTHDLATIRLTPAPKAQFSQLFLDRANAFVIISHMF